MKRASVKGVQALPPGKRQSRRAHHEELLQSRVAGLEERRPTDGDLVPGVSGGVSSERARHALFKPDGTLKFLHYSGPSGKRGAVLQMSCKVAGLPLLHRGLIVDGKDFSSVYERAIRIIAETFGVENDADLIRDMLDTRDAFLRKRGLRLVEVKYQQIAPLGEAESHSMEQQGSDMHDDVQAKVAVAGELLIRAAATIGTLTREQQLQLGVLTEGKLTVCLAWALQGAATISPAVAMSLNTHGPNGFVALEPRSKG